MKKEYTFSDKVWQFFCSVHLAVYTLVLLALTSIIGTAILQNGTQQQYLREYGPAVYNIIKVFQFDNMYQAWWFLALIVLLCINIVVCSIERLSITWKIIFPQSVSFNKNRFRKLKNLETFTSDEKQADLADRYESVLKRSVGHVTRETDGDSVILYAEKGRWTRIGVYVVHASILLLLVGALIGSVFGFKARLNLDEGQSSDHALLAKGNMAVDLGFEIRCNDFEVRFYDTGAPEEFRSNLTIIENGKESFTADIRVNHPLRYKGINIFQASYGTATPASAVFEVIRSADKKVFHHTLKIGDRIDLPEDGGQFLLEGFLPHFDFRGQNLGAAFVGRLFPTDGDSFQIGLPINPRLTQFDRMRKGDFAFIVKETEERYYTGLQVTKDPGVWYVYAGFLLMIAGCWITFFMSHQSYMIEINNSQGNDSEVSLSGTTNRNTQGMKLKIKKMLTRLKG